MLKPSAANKNWNVWNVSDLKAEGSLSGQPQARRDVDIVYEKLKKEGRKGEAELRATSSQSTAVPGSLGAFLARPSQEPWLSAARWIHLWREVLHSPHWTPNILGPDLLLPGHLEVYCKSPNVSCHWMKNYALVWSVLEKSFYLNEWQNLISSLFCASQLQ